MLASWLTLKVIDDSSNDVRESGVEAVGTLLKVCGERAVGPFLEKVDPIKMTKIREYFDKAEVKVVAAVGSSRPGTAASVASRKPSSASAAPPKAVSNFTDRFVMISIVGETQAVNHQ